MFWLPTQTGFNIKEMDWLKYWMSREGTVFRAGCPEFWVLDSVFHPVWLSCSVWEPAGWSHTRPHTSTMTSRERGRSFPEFCPKYGETFAKSSRHACQRASRARARVEDCPWAHLPCQAWSQSWWTNCRPAAWGYSSPGPSLQLQSVSQTNNTGNRWHMWYAAVLIPILLAITGSSPDK